MIALKKYTLFIILIILITLFGILNPIFFSFENLFNIVDQVSIIGIISLGITLIIIVGGIDLSVGSIVAFTGVCLALLLSNNYNFLSSILICLFVGSFLGFINGLFISRFKVPAFITTLGMMSIVRGATLQITQGRSISNLPSGLSELINSSILNISFPVLLFFILYLSLWFVLNRTYWGKYLYATGSNEKAAWLSGINTTNYKTIVYIVSGVLCAISSIILVGKLNSAQPTAGNMYELNAIAAVVIGGASLSGGKGTITGTLLGVLILGVLQNGFSILNISPYYQQILLGIIVIFAVLSDNKSKL